MEILPHRKVVVRCVTRTGVSMYNCHTPDDGCKKRPKHVVWSRSEIKITTQLHLVGLFNNHREPSASSVIKINIFFAVGKNLAVTAEGGSHWALHEYRIKKDNEYYLALCAKYGWRYSSAASIACGVVR